MYGNHKIIFSLSFRHTKFLKEDLEEYVKCVECLKEFSKQAKLFVLVHKMDLVPKEDRKKIYRGISKSLKQISLPFKITTYQTRYEKKRMKD